MLKTCICPTNKVRYSAPAPNPPGHFHLKRHRGHAFSIVTLPYTTSSPGDPVGPYHFRLLKDCKELDDPQDGEMETQFCWMHPRRMAKATGFCFYGL